MKSDNFDLVKKHSVGLIAILLTILVVWACNDEMVIEEEIETNISIETRYINNDSISTLDAMIATFTTEIETLTATIATQQADLDTLNMLIEENPEDENLADWQEQVAKITANLETNQSAVNTAQSASSALSSKRDSLDDGYSFLTSVTNLNNGAADEVDSLLTAYPLILDFNTDAVAYRIVVGDTTADIALSYSLLEEIDIEGRVSLVLDTLEVTENNFDSLTLTDEGIYIFYY